jgi:RimJ/RimL family protein N-acetyltransferase
MFARTERLLLRPGWSQDAPALFEAIADERIVRNLATAPWPYSLADAEAFLATERKPSEPSLLIFRCTADAPELIGGIGFGLRPSGEREFGYWLARRHWGRGYATEAGRALLATARLGLRLKRLDAGHFLDNPASGRVLEKLGFRPTGVIAPRYSAGRGGMAPCRLFELELDTESEIAPAAMAA